MVSNASSGSLTLKCPLFHRRHTHRRGGPELLCSMCSCRGHHCRRAGIVCALQSRCSDGHLSRAQCVTSVCPAGSGARSASSGVCAGDGDACHSGRRAGAHKSDPPRADSPAGHSFPPSYSRWDEARSHVPRVSPGLAVTKICLAGDVATAYLRRPRGALRLVFQLTEMSAYDLVRSIKVRRVSTGGLGAL